MATATSFEKQLKTGQIAEGRIATWLRETHGWDVLPVYEIEKHTGKGPRLFTRDRSLIAPDILALKQGKVMWIEAKSKSVFSWHRLTRQWVTGIDLRHYADYQTIAKRYPWELRLLFLHTCSMPWKKDLRHGCPAICPTGLFGETIDNLTKSENHRSMEWGKGGMVYWSDTSLIHIASLDALGINEDNQIW